MTAERSKNCIAVALDLTETGDNALREGMRLARQLPGSELHVVHVVHTGKDVHDARRLDELSKQLGARIEEIKAHVASVCAPNEGAQPFSQETAIHVRLGEPAQAIHQAAVDVDADMIVVGTHRKKGVEKLILGSVAEQLLRAARVPVVIAHPKDFSGLAKSARPDAPRPGQDLHAAGLSMHSRLEFRPRTSHISGLV
jgi:nucleotide-binding universal stress UspA family protein